MRTFIDLAGERFGLLVALRHIGAGTWLLRCDCGKEHITLGSSLRRGKVKSCGCLKRGTHGHSHVDGKRTRTYSSWQNMIGRVTQPSNPAFDHYRKRGIDMDPRWRDFANFLTDMGERPEGNYTLDRIDNDKGYWSDNCRWATKREQANNRVTNLLFEYRGKTYTLANLARETGVSKEVLRSRLCRCDLDWTVEDAVNTPLHGRGRGRRKKAC
jgi:hypothetical protein